MNLPLTIFVAAVGFIVAVALPPAVIAYLRFRGSRPLRCPLNGRIATIRIDPWHAAVTAFPGPARMHVERCSQWPAYRSCGEVCVTSSSAVRACGGVTPPARPELSARS